jgi:2-oxo-4-hydroxy-4-carboxy-5-ureidoimidazoline decarboxylase
MDKREAFVKKYAAIYEHSPWIAEAAYTSGDIGTIDKIHAAMKAAIETAGYAQKMALIRAHPDLACAPATKLTQESVSEQKGAGLDRCTPEEYAEFQKLNAEYKKKFGFPFIIAVKGLSRQDILVAFRARINNGAEKEFHTALEQIHKIARFRLEALIVR